MCLKMYHKSVSDLNIQLWRPFSNNKVTSRYRNNNATQLESNAISR